MLKNHILYFIKKTRRCLNFKSGHFSNRVIETLASGIPSVVITEFMFLSMLNISTLVRSHISTGFPPTGSSGHTKPIEGWYVWQLQ